MIGACAPHSNADGCICQGRGVIHAIPDHGDLLITRSPALISPAINTDRVRTRVGRSGMRTVRPYEVNSRLRHTLYKIEKMIEPGGQIIDN
jgi:hypothetical protein